MDEFDEYPFGPSRWDTPNRTQPDCVGAPMPGDAAEQPQTFDLVAHLVRQRAFSRNTFGPGHRSKGVVDHIRKELLEIEADPLDLVEWIDVVLLALDGAWRTGASPSAIARTLEAKQTKNECRQWPDWRTMSPDEGIQHVRGQNESEGSGHDRM